MSTVECITILYILFMLVFVNAEAKTPHYRIPNMKPIPCQKIVDKSSHGHGSDHFSTIQSAIDSVPSNNANWVCIFIKSGTYREKVMIPYDKPYIILKGERKRTTQVIWNDNESLLQSPTFASMADNVVVSRITFENSFNNPHDESNNPRKPAVAAMVYGDKTTFYRCGFVGVQDTLWDVQGRHYFHRCSISGAVDFIFGSGQSMYEGCSIQYLGGEIDANTGGYITAQGRDNPKESNGFVFKNCLVHGKGTAYLGRPWRSYARVFFYNSSFSNVVHPQGWDAWQMSNQQRSQLTFSEDDCFGPGSNTTGRVPWEKKLSAAEVKELSSITFIDNEGWLRKQPF